MSSNGNDYDADNQNVNPHEKHGGTTDSAPSRRDFNRRAATGVAAVAMLANRPAWGTSSGDACVSANAWDSMAGGNYSMAPENRFAEEKSIEKDLRAQADENTTMEFDEDSGCLVPSGESNDMGGF